jgi:hypothetical protein
MESLVPLRVGVEERGWEGKKVRRATRGGKAGRREDKKCE